MTVDSEFHKVILNGTFTFTPRPDPVPGDLRMSWGLATLVLALHFSRVKKSNFQKLQFLAHSVRIEAAREEVRKLTSGAYKPSDISVSVCPESSSLIA